MKKLIMVLCALFCSVAHAGPIANIEYIHALIKQRHRIDIEYSPELADPRLAANMKYLLSVVDIANTRINRAKFTNYGENAQYATLNAADTNTVITAVDELIKQIEFPFSFAPATESNEYMFTISAAGNFYIDWGDGIGQIIKKTKVGAQQITHTYENAANTYTIRLGGRATGYSTNVGIAAISFWDADSYNSTRYNESQLKSFDGCLGCIFSTVGDGSINGQQPRFVRTFQYNPSLTSAIPPNLFDGIHGQPANNMFEFTFDQTPLSGEIPENLFAGLSGTPTSNLFLHTFLNASGLIGEIPENLFSGIKGAPMVATYRGTFNGARGLTGAIPGKLFAGLSGAPTNNLFESTFSQCTGLTGPIPENLFAGIKGKPAPNMFYATFLGASNISGEIPENLFAGIQGAPAASMFASTFASTGITSIPENLFAGISGAPAASMFSATFQNSKNLIGPIPENLFAGIQGVPAANMFNGTFSSCQNLTGPIPENLFAGIQGAPASSMFQSTFYGCSSLSGEIPGNLFAGINGAPAASMFSATFYDCKVLGDGGRFPENIFAGIDDTAPSAPTMFQATFDRCCRGLTGSSARINGKYLYDIWPDFTPSKGKTGGETYLGLTGLDDYADMPDFWKYSQLP